MDNLLSHATPTDEFDQRNACVNVDALYFPLGSRTSSDVRGFCLSSDSDTCLSRRHAQTADRIPLRPFAHHGNNYVSPVREFRVAGTCASRSLVVCQRSFREQWWRITTSGYPLVADARVRAVTKVRICHDYEQGFCGSVTGASL
jgi:hypothetical protein